ncbi:DUF5359 family protein [Thalassobacillus pellis]|uniref:DUF5359 family protein n=1 Tax=Thalassobacillus pellis TaxID=748008 RepID=UPI00195F6069|nr:hypothetical protein [Thalassobacillus pellis]
MGILKKTEKIIIGALLAHGLLLIIAQFLLLNTEWFIQIQPVYDYIGVYIQQDGSGDVMDF